MKGFSVSASEMATVSSSSSSSSLLLLFLLFSTFSSFSSSAEHPPFKVIDLTDPILKFTPSTIVGSIPAYGANKVVSCERIQIPGQSRLKISSYANSIQVTLKASATIPERLHNKVKACFHWNFSTGMCECGNVWAPIEKGQWTSVISPYGDKYVDVKFLDGVTGPVTISIKEEFQQWRIMCLGIGFMLLLVAPIVSSWVPFYYSSSMALGVMLVILVVLFQGMKLLPGGRKNMLYVAIYGSLLGVGSFIVNYFSDLVNSVLINFGLGEEMHKPVSALVLVLIALAGAALGYWFVRKFVLSEDGSVDAGIAQFVKWAMRILATMFIFLSSMDYLLAGAAYTACWCVCFLINFKMPRSYLQRTPFLDANARPRRARQVSVGHRCTEFLSPSTRRNPTRPTLENSEAPFAWSPNRNSRMATWQTPNGQHAWSDSPTRGVIHSSRNLGSDFRQRNSYASPNQLMRREQNHSSPQQVTTNDFLHEHYPSIIHNTPDRRRFTIEEWDEFTRDSTQQALADLASTPQFVDWFVDNANHLKLEETYDDDDGDHNSNDSNEDDNGSQSDSSDGTVVENGGTRVFNWF